MTTQPTIRTYRGFVLVPVIDDETGGVLCWDAHPETGQPDETDGEPVATGVTLRDVMADVRDHIRFEKAFGWRNHA